MSIAIEKLAEELHEASRRAGDKSVVWILLSEISREIQRNVARQLVKNLYIQTKEYMRTKGVSANSYEAEAAKEKIDDVPEV